jgi:hypothetical protein
MLDDLPDELVVIIVAMLIEREESVEAAAFVFGSSSRRSRAMFKAALARSSSKAVLHVSGCASAAACIAAFPAAPMLAIEAQVTAPMLAAVVRNTRLSGLCVGAVLTSSPRSARSLMRALAGTGIRALDVTMWHTESIGLVTSLECLTVLASNARSASCFSGLTRLRDLELASCHRLRDITGLAGLTGLAALTSLTRLSISFCSRLRDLGPVASLTSLVELTIVSPTTLIRGMRELTALVSLRVLRVRRAAISARTVARLTTLESLTIQRSWSSTALASLTTLTSLRRLDYEYYGIASGARLSLWPEGPVGPSGPVGPVGQGAPGPSGPNGPRWPGPSSLTSLRLCHVEIASDRAEYVAADGANGPHCAGGAHRAHWAHRADGPMLTELHLSDIRKMRTLPALPASLRVLSLHRCSALTDASSAFGLGGLHGLGDPSGPSGPSGLRDLSVSSCTRLRLFDAGSQCRALEGLCRLELTCDTMDLASVAGLRALRKLTVWAASGIEGLEHLRGMPALTEITVGSFPTTTDQLVATIHELTAQAPTAPMAPIASVSLTGCNPELVSRLTALAPASESLDSGSPDLACLRVYPRA